MIEWLRLCADKAGGISLIPGQRTRSHMWPKDNITTIKKKKKRGIESRLMVSLEVKSSGKRAHNSQRLPTSRYKMKEFWGLSGQRGDYN